MKRPLFNTLPEYNYNSFLSRSAQNGRESWWSQNFENSWNGETGVLILLKLMKSMVERQSFSHFGAHWPIMEEPRSENPPHNEGSLKMPSFDLIGFHIYSVRRDSGLVLNKISQHNRFHSKIDMYSSWSRSAQQRQSITEFWEFLKWKNFTLNISEIRQVDTLAYKTDFLKFGSKSTH